VDEAPVWISVNGVRSIVLMCTPSETDALAVGHLIGAGWIDAASDILSLRTASGPGGACGVEVELDDDLADAGRARQRHARVHGCGPRHILDCADGRHTIPRHSQVLAEPPPGGLADAFRALFAAADAASPEGGVHAAALFDGSALHHAAVDVARHCAVDRTIGIAALAGDDPAAFGLVATSRISGVIALKAVHARVSWAASRSIATSLAREIAAAAGMPLLERAAARPGRTAP
jgi:FdhD protein